MPIANAELQLMLAENLRQVLVEIRQDLALAVIELRPTVGHDQVGSDRGKTGLREVIGKPQQRFVISVGNLGALYVLPHPLLAHDRLGKECRRKEMRVPNRGADGLDRLSLVARSPGR